MRKDSETGLDEQSDAERIESDSIRAEPEIAMCMVYLKPDSDEANERERMRTNGLASILTNGAAVHLL